MTKGKTEPEIVFEDYYLIVINKPRGLVSEAANPLQPSAKTLVEEYLKNKYPENKKWFLGVPHRLDKPVGGIWVLAKTPQALKKLNQQFAEHTTQKKYLAWVQGKMEGYRVTLEHFIGRDESGKKALVSNTLLPGFKSCSLIFSVLKNEKDKTLVEIELITGRYHQIRAQFSHLGHPVLGDELYGSHVSDAITLWSVRLTLKHPKSNEAMNFSLPQTYLQRIHEGSF